MSLPKRDYEAGYDDPIRVYGRGHKDHLLERLKELHPEQDPYRERELEKARLEQSLNRLWGKTSIFRGRSTLGR